MLILFDSLSIVFLILSWWIAISSYPRLPEAIPVHFGIKGEPDRWGGRWMIFLLPAFQSMIFAMQYLIFNYVDIGASKPTPEAMKPPLHLLMVELQVLFAYLTWRTSEIAFERAKGLGSLFLPVIL